MLKNKLKEKIAEIEKEKEDLEIDLQMANDTIADYKGEVAELKVPGGLTDCAMTDTELIWLAEEEEAVNLFHDVVLVKDAKDMTRLLVIVAKAQLQSPKLKAYIEHRVAEAIKAERKRILKIVTEQQKVVEKEHGSPNIYLDMFEELIYEEVSK